MPQTHYENFPVASILLPRRLRRPVRLIYAFARQADDFADEDELDPGKRLELLDGFRSELRRIEAGMEPETSLFRELAAIIAIFHLPLAAFYDLLDAFSQDVVKQRYANFEAVMDYCRRSANPVGRLLLHLYGAASDINLRHSDAICSSLQLINFLQDIAIDYQKGRIYLPQDELAEYKIAEQQIAQGNCSGNWHPFMLFQIERVEKFLHSGAPLGRDLKGRTGLEMRMIIQGGGTILRKLRKMRGDVFRQRPVLGPADWVNMFFRAITNSRPK